MKSLPPNPIVGWSLAVHRAGIPRIPICLACLEHYRIRLDPLHRDLPIRYSTAFPATCSICGGEIPTNPATA